MQPQEATPSPLALGKRASHNFVRHTRLHNFAFHRQAFHKAAVVGRRVAAVDKAEYIAADRAVRIVVVAVDTVGRTAADMVGCTAAGTAVVDRVVVDRVVVDRVGRTVAVAGNSMSIRSAVRDTAVVRTVAGRIVVARTEENIVALDIGAQHSRKVPGDRLGDTLEPAASHKAASSERAEDSSRVDSRVRKNFREQVEGIRCRIEEVGWALAMVTLVPLQRSWDVFQHQSL